MSRTRTLARRVRRTAVLTATTLALVLVPTVAYAAGDTPAAPTAGTGGSTVSMTTGVIAIGAALYFAYRRGALLLVLLGVAAGTMMSGTTFAGSLSDMADGLIRAVLDAVSGIFT